MASPWVIVTGDFAPNGGQDRANLALAGEFGQMAALQGDDVVAVPLAEATAELKVVPREWYEVARAFFG